MSHLQKREPLVAGYPTLHEHHLAEPKVHKHREKQSRYCRNLFIFLGLIRSHHEEEVKREGKAELILIISNASFSRVS